MRHTYPSKIDGVIWVPALILLAVAGGQIVITPPPGLQAELRLIFFGVLGLVAWVILGTWYALDSKFLHVRCGPFRWTIALRDIHSVTAARDIRSGPALSLDRLRVEYGSGRAILISPRDRDGFLHDLEHRRGAIDRTPPSPQ